MVAVTVSGSCSLHIPAERDTQRGVKADWGECEYDAISFSGYENVTIIASISGEYIQWNRV